MSTDATYAAVRLGLAQGTYKKHGIDLTITPITSAPAGFSAITSGVADIGANTVPTGITGIANGLPVKLIAITAIFGKPGNVQVLVPQGSSIQRYKDLVGKTVGCVALQGSFQLALNKAVAGDGGDYNKINCIPGFSPDQASAMNSGHLDAIIIGEPFLSSALAQYKFRSIGDLFAGVPYDIVSGGYWASNEEIQSKPQALLAFRQATVDAVAYANAHMDELKAEIAKDAGLTAQQVNVMKLQQYTGDICGVVTPKNITNMGNDMLTYGFIKYIPSPSQLVWHC